MKLAPGLVTSSEENAWDTISSRVESRLQHIRSDSVSSHGPTFNRLSSSHHAEDLHAKALKIIGRSQGKRAQDLV